MDEELKPQETQAAEDFLLPHIQQFQAVWQTPARTYRWTFDEALKRSKNHSLAMRRDGHILSLLQARYLPVLGAAWNVKSDDDLYKEQASKYQKLIEKTPRLLQLRKCLLEAVWFGRSGVQLAFGKVRIDGQEMTGITGWKPINGDKINFTFDGVPTIRVNAAWANRLKSEGASVEQADKVTAWNDQGQVLILNKPEYRNRFVIHVHEIEDADFTEPELAGSVGGVGLRHYCYWIWWLRQEIMEWLLNYLEYMGAGGLTIVGYDMANPQALADAQEAFKERATVVFLPMPPGADKQTNIVQRLEPSGTGNDIFKGWIDEYFNACLTRLIIGQDLSGQSGPTGLGSGVADLQADVKQCIHRYDAKNLNETETQQLLEVLLQLNEPNADYNLRCETVLQEVNSEAGLQAAKQAYDMGAGLPESHVLKLASIPEPKEGERVLTNPQLAHEAGLASMYASQQQGGTMGLEEARKMLEQSGVPEEEQLHQLADMVDNGELEEIDADGGVQYAQPKQQQYDGMESEKLDEPETYAKEDWREETGPKGARRWVNLKTGRVEYREPGDERTRGWMPGEDKSKPRETDKGERSIGNPRKGVLTQGAYQTLDKALRGESSKTLQGEGVLSHVMHADKRLMKDQVVSLAAQHGMTIDSKTTKTRALAYIEDKLRANAKKLEDSGDEPAVTAKRNDSKPASQDSPADGGDAGTGGTGQSAGGLSDKPDAAQQQADTDNQPADTGNQRDGGSDSQSSGMGDRNSVLFDSALEKADLTSKMREQYGKTARQIHDRLPAAAKERFSQNVESVNFHESPEVLTEKLKEANPKMTEVVGNKKAGGAYSKMRKELMLNGGHTMDGKKYTADQIYAHEYSHAIDGPDKELSSSSEWQQAWKAEADKVSKYATKTPAEGFAEFGRLVYAGELGSDQLRERYPQMMAHWEQAGLLPDDMKQTGGTLAAEGKPQLPDVFEEPFETPEHIGDKALSRRGSGESLKDYLTGIGGGAAHDQISEYAGQLHGQEQEKVDQHNAAVRYANEAIMSYSGKRFDKNHPAFKTGDMTQIPNLDEIATSVDSEYPGLLQGEDKTQALYERMKEGIKPDADRRQFEDQAVQEWHDNGRPIPGEQAEGEAAEPENADTSFDFGGEGTGKDDMSYEDFSSQYGEAFKKMNKYKPGQIGNDEAVEEMASLADKYPHHLEKLESEGKSDFMQPEASGPHSADDIPSYAGQSFTNDQGATVDVRKADDGTWSVGSKTGLSQAAAAKHLNSMKAVKAKGLFSEEVTAQKPTGKPKEKLQWAEPSKKKESPELPGMKDTFAPGMFGQAKTEAEKQKNKLHRQAESKVKKSRKDEDDEREKRIQQYAERAKQKKPLFSTYQKDDPWHDLLEQLELPHDLIKGV